MSRKARVAGIPLINCRRGLAQFSVYIEKEAYNIIVVVFSSLYLNNYRERLMLMKSENYFLLAAFGSFVFSVTLWFLGDSDVNKHQAIFVGLWVPSILSLGNLLK